MTRAEHLVYCKKCTNRKMDLQQGIICALTSEKADFEESCPEFNLDNTVKEVPISTEPFTPSEIHSTIPSDVIEQLRSEQNYSAAVIAGLVAGMIGAILWGIITVATGYQIGYVAVAIGAGVGFAMKYFGKGIDPVFGFTGAIIAVVSCVVGNFLSIIGFVANMEGLGYMETLFLFDYAILPEVMKESFSIMDLVFYGIAGYEGYKFSFRTINQDEVNRLS